jgi:DNA-directed RNA polymerase beta' subunit
MVCSGDNGWDRSRYVQMRWFETTVHRQRDIAAREAEARKAIRSAISASPKEVKSYSAVYGDPFGINVSESYQNYEPTKGGLVDLRLGTCDIYLNCLTCGLNNDCPGSAECGDEELL